MRLRPAFHRAGIYANLLYPIQIDRNASIGQKRAPVQCCQGSVGISPRTVRDAAVVCDPGTLVVLHRHLDVPRQNTILTFVAGYRRLSRRSCEVIVRQNAGKASGLTWKRVACAPSSLAL